MIVKIMKLPSPGKLDLCKSFFFIKAAYRFQKSVVCIITQIPKAGMIRNGILYSVHLYNVTEDILLVYSILLHYSDEQQP